MSITLVSAGTVSSGTTTIHPAFGATTKSGSLLICWGFANNTGSPSIDQGWNSTVFTVTLSGGVITAILAFKGNCSPGETAPTISFGSPAPSVTFGALAEFAGVLRDTSNDIPPSDVSGRGTGTSSPYTAATVGLDVDAGELVVSSSAFASTKAESITTSDSYNNGGVAQTNLNNDSTSTTTHYRFSWAVTTSNAVADSNTVSNSSMRINEMATVLVSFRLGLFSPPFSPRTARNTLLRR